METLTIIIIWIVAAVVLSTCFYAIHKINQIEKAFPFKIPKKQKVSEAKPLGTTPPMRPPVDTEVQL